MSKPFSIKFLVDESVEYGIVLFLRAKGFDVYSISEENPSISDPEVLDLAYKQKRVLITNDKGFSKLIFKDKLKSYGVILIRLPYTDTIGKVTRLSKIIDYRVKDLPKLFITITDKQVRSKRLPYGKIKATDD